MPNEVYEMTHTALSALVSQRAATRVLDDALRAGGTDAETVTVRAMRRLLAGTIRRELSSTLPSPGLTRSLKQIADDLYRLRPSHTTLVDKPVEAAPEAVPARAEEPAGPSEAGPSEAAPSRQGVPSASRRPGGTEVAGPRTAPRRDALPITTDAKAAQAPSRKVAPTSAPAQLDAAVVLDEAVMMSALRLFGELEPVKQVVVVRGGEVLLERGFGAPTESLPNLVRSTQHLLTRAGRLKLFSVERAEGVLFVFPVGDGAVVVLSEPNVNIGAVLSARAALEEAA